MKRKEIRQLLFENFGADDDPGCVGYRKGVFTVRREFYYSHGKTERDLEQDILKVVPTARILGSARIDNPFRGGEGVRRNSHWWVAFTVNED